MNEMLKQNSRVRARAGMAILIMSVLTACGSNPDVNRINSSNPYGVAPSPGPANGNPAGIDPAIAPLGSDTPAWGPGMIPMEGDPCCCCDPCADASARRTRSRRSTSSSSSSSSSTSSDSDQDAGRNQSDDSDRNLPPKIVMSYRDDGKNQIDYRLQLGDDGQSILIQLNSIDGKSRPGIIPLTRDDDAALNQSVQNLVNRQIRVWNGTSNGTDRITLQIDDLNHPKSRVTIIEPAILDQNEGDLFDRIRDYIRKHLPAETVPPADPGNDGQPDTRGGLLNDPADNQMQQLHTAVDHVDAEPVPQQTTLSDDPRSQVKEVPGDSPKDVRVQAGRAFDQAEVRFSTQALYFATGKADLDVSKKKPAGSTEETTTLNQVIKTGRLFALLQDKIKTITIVGQADKVGSDESNLILSGKRAKRVAAVMTDPDSYKGLEGTGISIKPLEGRKVFFNGIGEPDASSCTDPSSGKPVENCPQDRRVWFFVDLVENLAPEERTKLMKELNTMMIGIWGTDLQTQPDKPRGSTVTRKKNRSRGTRR